MSLMIDEQKLSQPIQGLYDACKISEEDLHAASEQMENRGQKYLFKRFAQRHRRFARELADLLGQMGIRPSDPGRFRNTFKRGWRAIRIGMIVPRANRQEAAAAKCAEGERRLLTLYDEVLELALPDAARSVIVSQRDSVTRIHRWLQRIADQEQFIVRLYDSADEADQAVHQLVDSGFAESRIEVTPLRQTVLYQGDPEERVQFTTDAALVGGLLLGVLGAAIGLFAGYAIPHAVPEVPDTESQYWFSTLVWGLQGAAVGVFFGGVFGFLLGRGQSEDDAALVRAMSNADAVVVSVRTTTESHTDAARILEIRHQRELETVPAWEYR
jgi:uncharacterized protein (TIGR02284 family)